jgi:hypothetical protein
MSQNIRYAHGKMQTTELVAIIVSAVAALVGIIAVAYSNDDDDDDSGATDTGDAAGEDATAADIKDLEYRFAARVSKLGASVAVTKNGVTQNREVEAQKASLKMQIKKWIVLVNVEGVAVTPGTVEKGEQILVDGGDEAGLMMQTELGGLYNRVYEALRSKAIVGTSNPRMIEVLDKTSKGAQAPLFNLSSDGSMRIRSSTSAPQLTVRPFGSVTGLSVTNCNNDVCRYTTIKAPFFDTETVRLPNGKDVHFAMEELTPAWEAFGRMAGIAFNSGIALVIDAGNTIEGITLEDRGNIWRPIQDKMRALATTDTSSLEILSKLGGGIAGFGAVSEWGNRRKEKPSWWEENRYVTYATDVPVTAPFVHGQEIPEAPMRKVDGITEFLNRYSHVLMVMTTGNVENTPFYFNRGITKMPAHLLDGRRGDYPVLSMYMHAFSARVARKLWNNKQWLLVSAIDSMLNQVKEHMLADAYRVEGDVGNPIEKDLQPIIEKIAWEYGKGGGDKNTIIDARRLAEWTPAPKRLAPEIKILTERYTPDDADEVIVVAAGPQHFSKPDTGLFSSDGGQAGAVYDHFFKNKDTGTDSVKWAAR